MRMLGHMLRLDRKTPAQKSMDLYFADKTRRRGRPIMRLPIILSTDLTMIGMEFKNLHDLTALREKAADKDLWSQLAHLIAPKMPKTNGDN